MAKAKDTTTIEETTPDVPEEFRDRPLGWRLAYQHAADYRNTSKACFLYAETRQGDFGGADSVDSLQAGIDALQAELDALPEE